MLCERQAEIAFVDRCAKPTRMVLGATSMAVAQSVYSNSNSIGKYVYIDTAHLCIFIDSSHQHNINQTPTNFAQQFEPRLQSYLCTTSNQSNTTRHNDTHQGRDQVRRPLRHRPSRFQSPWPKPKPATATAISASTAARLLPATATATATSSVSFSPRGRAAAMER